MRFTEMTNQPRAEKINKVVESRFGFKIDYANLTFKKAYGIVHGLNETLDRARRTHGAHNAEKNPQYMEMLMVREALNRWMVQNRQTLINESEMAKSEAILAAKDMVDSIQDMLEKIGKMQNEQLPALLDTIRDQIGDQQAETFKGSVTPLLQQLSQTLQQGRETADTAARGLTGEGGSDMGLGGMGGGDDLGAMGGGAPAPEPGMGGGEMGGDEFGATAAAAGGTDELGRERRGGLEEGAKENKPKKPMTSQQAYAHNDGESFDARQKRITQYEKSKGNKKPKHVDWGKEGGMREGVAESKRSRK